MNICFGVYKESVGFGFKKYKRAAYVNLLFFDIVFSMDSLISMGSSWKELAQLYAPKEEYNYLQNLISEEQIEEKLEEKRKEYRNA